MNYIGMLESEMANSADDPAWAGGCSEEDIQDFQEALGVMFPPSYKLFLRKFGALSFGGDTYYGITKSGLVAGEHPCVFFATQTARQQGDADAGMIVIKSSGYGPIYSIDTNRLGVSGEPVIVETELSFKRDKLKTLMFESFEAFLISSIRQSIAEL